MPAKRKSGFEETRPEYEVDRSGEGRGAAMSTMNVSLPKSMKDFIDTQVAKRSYSTSSEYLRDLVRREQDREHLRGLLLEGAKSPLAGPIDAAYFARLRKIARGRGKS